jgi:hypothetical protein
MLSDRKYLFEEDLKDMVDPIGIEPTTSSLPELAGNKRTQKNRAYCKLPMCDI